MNMRYAKRSEDTEQINVVSWAGWNMNRYPELKWLSKNVHIPSQRDKTGHPHRSSTEAMDAIVI